MLYKPWKTTLVYYLVPSSAHLWVTGEYHPILQRHRPAIAPETILTPWSWRSVFSSSSSHTPLQILPASYIQTDSSTLYACTSHCHMSTDVAGTPPCTHHTCFLLSGVFPSTEWGSKCSWRTCARQVHLRASDITHRLLRNKDVMSDDPNSSSQK